MTPIGTTPSQPRALLVTGTVGAGKTTVLDEMHVQLAARDLAHACVDLDALSLSWPARGPFNEIAALENLKSVWQNFAAAGASHVAIAAVVERREDVVAIQAAVGSSALTICQLTASEAARHARLQTRERGTALAWHLERTTTLQGILETAGLADFAVDNENRPLAEVAAEVLRRAGWIDPTTGD